MTIREWICGNEARMAEERLSKLETIGAPQVMLDGTRKAAEALRNGELDIGGNASLLDVEFENFTQKKGSGGKPYITINGRINYFPQARYGRYIALAK